ncbi:MAG: polysaccharide biosynthesis/export family protein [Alphaproteobacteria bacterium]|nr:polysaccharide biosynthesis/export family protein [Alphaproteobacteria bacterium]
MISIFLLRWHRFWRNGATPWLLLLCLTGCAYAPGWKLAPNAKATPDASNTAPRPDVDLIQISLPWLDQQNSLTAKTDPAIEPLLMKKQAEWRYLISPGDVLAVIVWNVPALNLSSIPGGSTPDANSVPSGYTVDAEGMIQFPYVGLIALAGLTEAQAQARLTQALSRHYVNPKLTVRVQAYRGNKVYMEGEVRTQGMLVMNDSPLTLAEALSRAGGITPLGDSSAVVLVRDHQRTELNLPGLQRSGISAGHILLRPGDMVRVTPREETKVSVFGEVVKPGMVPTRNGRLTLNEALAESGGLLSTTSDPRQIYVVRKRPGGVQAFHLDAHSPLLLPLADGFELQARDIVYVDAAPLALWNRVINLLIPSLGAGQTGKNIFN